MHLFDCLWSQKNFIKSQPDLTKLNFSWTKYDLKLAEILSFVWTWNELTKAQIKIKGEKNYNLSYYLKTIGNINHIGQSFLSLINENQRCVSFPNFCHFHFLLQTNDQTSNVTSEHFEIQSLSIHHINVCVLV